jgi:hypothetical protein
MKLKMIAAGTLTLALLALAPGLALAHGDETGVTVQPLTPKPDEVITVKGELLGPKSEVKVMLTGNGMDKDLGGVKANAEGDFTEKFRLPADLKPGTYQLKATGKKSATTQITVSGAPSGGSEKASSGAMGQEPVIKTRPLGQSIGLVALFGVLAIAGIFFAHMPMRRQSA